mmetsp:Transcript_126942/g.355525  ORF Transcript_126942/g.355525 Transcript_126942/m.355525 type:complete len:482 (+) Transcript_126942:163-1608(+)
MEEESPSSASATLTAEKANLSSEQAKTPPATSSEQYSGGGDEDSKDTTTNNTTNNTTNTNNKGEEDAPSSSKEDWEVQRDHEKQQGDQSFRLGGFKTAIGHYTQAISLDPEFAVAYSNRSAAYLKNGEKSKALRDAEQVTLLDPAYAKGYSRLAAALHSLKRWEQAKEAYQKVLELDAGNAVATKGVADCQLELDRIEEQQKQFEDEEGRQVEEAKKREEQEEAEKQAQSSNDQAKPEDENEDAEEEDDDDDDSLNDFFEDVEQVAKKEEVKPEAAPAPTNNVKKEKVILGTGKEQMDRLLQTNYEWRNLNPYYVLQLPSTATEDDIARRYKALSLMLHPDKNGGDPNAQLAFDEVKKAKTLLLGDAGRARHAKLLVEEGMKQGEAKFRKQGRGNGKTLEELQEIEVMRIFAQVEQKRREVEDRERKFEQRTQQQEDAQDAKERHARQFDKSWRKEERVDKRVGNWRDFASSGGTKKKQKH